MLGPGPSAAGDCLPQRAHSSFKDWLAPPVVQQQVVHIPQATATLRKQVMREGAKGWVAAADALARDIRKKMETALRDDDLLSDDDLALLDRVKAAANIAPYLPSSAVDHALGLPSGGALRMDPADVMYRIIVQVLSKWSSGTIALIASSWFRCCYYWHINETPPEDRFSGNTVDGLLRSVRSVALQKAAGVAQSNSVKGRRRHKDARSVRQGTHAEHSVRRGLAFLARHFGMPFPVDSALLKRGRPGKSHPSEQGEAVSLRVVFRLEKAATTHPSVAVRAACSSCLAMCFGCIRLDQVNRTQIIAEKSEQGCLFAYTDREKDPDINRASAKPLWIPILGLRDSSWHKELLHHTREVQLGGFLFRDDDSTGGSPFSASRLLKRPKRGRRALFAVRELLHHIGGIPRCALGRFGISSFRKFMPNIADRMMLDGLDRIEVGRWSGSDAKRLDHLLPAERVAGSFSARHAALPRMHYEQDSRVSRITGIMVSVVQRAREVLASVGEDHLPVRGGWSFFGPLQTSTETDPVGLEPAEDIVSEEESS